MLAVILLPFALHAQTMYLTVADSTATNAYVPVYGNYMDDPLGCQSIYPASMLTDMVGENILSLSYYVSSGSSSGWGSNKPMLVKLMVVTENDLSAGYIDVTNATTVYDGTISAGDATVDGGFTVDFTTPFMYTGGNLLVSFQINPNDVGGYTAINWYGKNMTAASRGGYGDGNYNYTSTGTVRDFLPKTTFMYGDVPTCFKVSGLTVVDSLTTASSLTLSWTDAINTGATYNLYDMSDTTLIQGGITGLTYTVTGLVANHPYAFGVQTDCGNGDIAAGYALTSGRTACGPISLPWTCSFEADEIQNTTQVNAIPWCTQRFVAPANVSSPNYPYSSTSYPHTGSRALYVYGTTSTSYPDTMALILPEIDVTSYSMNNNRLSFWARSSSTSYDKTVYVYALNNAADFANGVLIDSVVVTGTTHSRYIIPLTTASATAPYVALMVRRGTGSLYLDDVVFEEMPSCPEVTGLSVSNITAHGATLTWNGQADGYTIYNMSDSTVEQYTTDTTVDLYALDANTSYTFGVTSNCGADESPVTTISFTTLVSCPAPTALAVTYNPTVLTEVTLSWTENGEATAWQIMLNDDETTLVDVTTNPYTLTNLVTDSVYTVKVRANCGVGDLSVWSTAISFEPTTKTVIGSGNATNSYLPTYCLYNYSFTQQIFTAAELGEAGLIESIDFYNNGTAPRTRDLNIYVVNTTKDTFATNTDWINVTTADLQFSGSVTFDAQAWTTISLDGFAYNGTSNIAIIVDDNTGSWESSMSFRVFDAPKQALRIYSDGVNYDVTAPTYNGTVMDVKNQIRIVKGSLSGCLKPSAVAINYNGGTDAEVTWVSDAPSFNIEVNGVVTNNVSSPYALSGLTLGTTYTISVQAVCDATTVSSWTNPISFTTDACMPEDQCTITIVGADSYGDGWNGNAINVIQNSVVIGTFTLENDYSNTQTYTVCHNNPVTFQWVMGSYPGETSFQIQDGGSSVVFTGDGDDMIADNVFFTMANACPSCLPATALTVDNADQTSVTISWSGDAASYDVYQDGAYVASVTTNAYTFNGLSTGTAYLFGVQAICSAADTSAMTTIEVSTDCPPVTELPYYEGFENGLGCWSTLNFSNDGTPWFITNCAGLSTVDPHGGAYVVSSWSWNSTPMHADAWLISPKFTLPNTTDSLTIAWWEITSSTYPDKYSVLLSTTTKDTAAFTTVLRPYAQAAGTWTIQSADLTAFAGQDVYIAFHHQDYDMNYLLIDDIALYQGAYIPPAPDTLTVVFAVNDATMGTTNPAPGTYQYISGDTVSFNPIANPGYHFTNWVMSVGTEVDTLSSNYVSVYFLANSLMSYGTVTMTALFEADTAGTLDTLIVHIAVNDPTLGTTTPAVGTYYVVENDTLMIAATPNTGIAFDGFRVLWNGQILSNLPAALNPFPCIANPNLLSLGEITVMAMFNDGTSAPDSLTLIVNTADATMGTTNPAPGTYHIAVGDSATFSAVPNSGYEFLYWIESISAAGVTMYDTIYTPNVMAAVTPMMANMTLSVTAYFQVGGTAPCEAPTGLTVTGVTDESITITWDANPNVNSWNIQYGVAGVSIMNATSNTNSFTLSNLTPATTYTIQVQADCGDGNESVWTSAVTATTTVGIANRLENSVTLFPNPAREYVDIRVDGDLNVSMMEVYDVYGKLINTINVTDNMTRINISGLADGMYFVRVTTEEGMVTKTFVKR